jgi:glucose/arabinose dehydrogenase
VAETGAGSVRVFHPGASSEAAKGEIFAAGLQRPYGIAFYPSGSDPKFVYVASPDSVVRFPYRSGGMKASGPAEKIASLPSGGGHWTRDLAFSPDDKTLYVSVGSGSNVDEGVPRADQASIAEAPIGAWLSILTADMNGSTRPAFAIVQALRFSPERAPSGAPSMNATDSATTCRPTT